MNLQLDSLDVVKAAILLEEKGEKFYREAARTAEAPAQKLLIQLAEMEKMHASRFAEIAESLAKSSEVFNQEEQADELAFLDSLTNDRIIKEDCNITAADGLETIFHKAMQLEKNSVFFYTALKDSLLKNMSNAAIDALIAEEVKHYRMLNQALNELKTAGKA